MYTVRYKTNMLSDKDVRINLTILFTWIFLMFIFMFGLFLGHGIFSIICMLLMFFSMLCSIPVAIIIKTRTKKLQVETINELQLIAENKKLYCGKTQLYVKYDKCKDFVHLYSIADSTKGTKVKLLDIVILKEENSSFIAFCQKNDIDTNNTRNYVF